MKATTVKHFHHMISRSVTKEERTGCAWYMSIEEKQEEITKSIEIKKELSCSNYCTLFGIIRPKETLLV